MTKFPEFLFHYTVGPKLDLIAKSGNLLPTGFGGATNKREKPVLWWSSDSTWEPTAAKIVSRDGNNFFRPTIEELHDMCGVYRFRLDLRNPAGLHERGLRLLPWSQIPISAHIASRDAAQMVSAGLALGAKPMHWWGCLMPVPASLEMAGLLKLEALDAGQWAPVRGG